MSDIKRYNLDVTPDGQTGMFANDNGYWVSYSDHRQKFEEVLEEVWKLQTTDSHPSYDRALRDIEQLIKTIY